MSRLFSSKLRPRNSNPISLSILQSCNSLEQLKQVHAQLIATARIKDTYPATKMVESYAISARNIDNASRVFHGIHDPDSYSWTAMIRAYLEVKNPEKAIEVYEEMRFRGVELNRFTFLFVLKAYGFRPSFGECIFVHGKVLKMGLYLDVYIANGLIHLYSKCLELGCAHKVFEELPVRNMVNWNTIISACFSCGDVENGHRLFKEMPEKSVGSWNAVIIGFCKLGHVEIARSFFDGMPEKDLVSWSAMISGYVQSRRAVEALLVFNEMQCSGFSADSITITSILSACAQIGALDMGRWIHAYMERKKLMNDVILCTSLLDMYAKCGCIATSINLFHDMPQRNVCSWNAILSGLASHGQGSAALALFEDMLSSGMEPDDATFVAVLSACNHMGSADEGWKQFNRMDKEFNIIPKIEHYGCMVDVLGRAGKVAAAIELITSMPMQPNIIIWGALLHACKTHGYTAIAKDVMEYLQDLPSGDGGCYALMSNIFAGDKRWSEVEKTRRAMRETVVDYKIPGCSSIEVNGLVHEFFAEDRVHLSWEELNEVVKRLCTHYDSESHVSSDEFIL